MVHQRVFEVEWLVQLEHLDLFLPVSRLQWDPDRYADDNSYQYAIAHRDRIADGYPVANCDRYSDENFNRHSNPNAHVNRDEHAIAHRDRITNRDRYPDDNFDRHSIPNWDANLNSHVNRDQHAHVNYHPDRYAHAYGDFYDNANSHPGVVPDLSSNHLRAIAPGQVATPAMDELPRGILLS